MAISKEDVLHVARLARLRLSDSEVEIFTRQLSDILSHMSRLAEVDTRAVPPTATIQDLRNVLRSDKPDRGIERGLALRNAPDQRNGMFRVPSALDEGDSA